ncbi:MAG: shikimate dehydrogenase [Gemmataceae bacterium]
MICVSIGRTRHKMVLAEIQEAAKRGAQLIELRLDFLARAPDFKRLLADKPCPMVATARRIQDGGRWARSEEERLMLLRQAIVGGFDWVDLETDIAERIPRFRHVKRIVSYHNLREFPDDLEEIHMRMSNQDADVIKLAVRAMHPADNIRVLELVQRSRQPTVAFCVGDLGTLSRILAGRFGAPFTYAAFNKERGIAPGILSFDEMRAIYRYDHITPRTRIFAVIGDPVAHSLSPVIHNGAFRTLGLDCVYLPVRIPRGDLEESLQALDRLPVEGYSVTIPHKEAAARLARQRDSRVDAIGAANTLVRASDGGFAAYNTDAPAAVESLLFALAQIEDPPRIAGKSVLILGAGGAARAVAFGLHQAGALLTITNRTPERAQELAAAIGCRVVDWAARHAVTADIVVNCTSVGMHPHVDESPLHVSFLRPGLVVFDIVYNPENTLLVKQARERGCHVLTGVDMFVRQALLQFKHFTGQEAPRDLMEKLVRRALSPVKWSEEEFFA